MAAYVRFFTTSFGARIAYATHGAGPPLVYLPPLTSHIAVFWEEPSFRAFYEMLAPYFTLIRYDRYGCGLSDRDRTDFRWEVDVRVLDELVDHLGLPQAALFGQSTGATIALRYALARPERVAHLLLWGVSWEHTAQEIHSAVTQLIRADWRLGANSVADLLLPTAPPAIRMSFARVMREAATAEMMAGLREAGGERGLAALLPGLRVPTLIIARRDDQVIPLASASALARHIPGAHLAILDGDCYVAEYGDIAAVVRAIGAFTSVPVAPAGAATPARARHGPTGEGTPLTARELEVLRLVAEGLTDAAIAARLLLSPRTVGQHLRSVYRKRGLSSRSAATRYALEHHLA